MDRTAFVLCANRHAVAALSLGLLAGCGARSALTLDEKDTAPPSAEVRAPRFDCSVSNSSRPMLAARLGSSIYFVYPDRSFKEVLSFDVPEGMYVTQADVIARGDRVAVYFVVAALAGAKLPAPFAEVAVLHTDGAVLYQDRHDFAYEGWGSDSHLVGNDQGLFVLSLLEVKANLGLVLDKDGAHPFTERMAARSDPDSLGRLVMWDGDANSTADLHFFDTDAATFTPSKYISLDPFENLASTPAVLGSGMLYIRRDPARLIFEDASGTSEIGLDVLLTYPGHATPGWASSGGYKLFMLGGQSETEARYLATHFASGEVRHFQLDPPDGYQLPGDFWNPPPIDSKGRLLFALSNGEHAQLFATKDGASWEELGLPITAGGYPVSLNEAGGTVIFDVSGGGVEVPGELPPWTDQLIGPQGGDGIVLVRHDPGAPDNPYYADDEISGDGACVAYFRSGSLHVIEVSDYSSSDVGLLAETTGAEMAWIPLPE